MQEFIELLYQAYQSPHGIVVLTSDVSLAKQKFYKARKEAQDPELLSLRFHTSPILPEEEIWITKDGKERVGKADAA